MSFQLTFHFTAQEFQSKSHPSRSGSVWVHPNKACQYRLHCPQCWCVIVQIPLKYLPRTTTESETIVSSQAEKENLERQKWKKIKVKALLRVSQSSSDRESKEQSFNERERVRRHAAHTFLNLGTAVFLMQQSTREKKVFNFTSDIVRLS